MLKSSEDSEVLASHGTVWDRKEELRGRDLLVEHGLISETPVVDLVGDFGYLFPRFAAVDGLEDWEINERWFGTVILPRG